MEKVHATKQQITDSFSGIINLMHSHLFTPMDLLYMENTLRSLHQMVRDAENNYASSLLSEKVHEKLKYITDTDTDKADADNRAINQ